MAIRILPTNKGGNPLFAGWNSAWSDAAINNKQQCGCIDQNAINYYYAWANGGAAANCFQFAPIATPGTVTTPVFPISTDLQSLCAMPNNDTIYIGTSQATNARVYQYQHSSGLFTNLNFTDFAVDDSIRVIHRHPTDPNVILVGTNAAAASGSASLWKYDISGATWTNLNNFGANGARMVQAFCFYQNVMYLGFGCSGALNLGRIYRSDNFQYTAFTQIAGDGVNGSWATGTLREAYPIVANGNLYVGLRGATNGDAEVWKSPDFGTTWTKIGGDGINGGWTGKLFASRMAGVGTKIVVGLGTAAGDAEVWQWDENTDLWTQIGGDSINSSWSNAKNIVGFLFSDSNNVLVAGGGNSTINTSFLYTVAGGPFVGGVPGFSYQPYPIFAMW